MSPWSIGITRPAPTWRPTPLLPAQRKIPAPPSGTNGRPPFPLRPPTWMQAQADPLHRPRQMARPTHHPRQRDGLSLGSPSRTPPAGSRPRHRHRSGYTTPPQRTRRPPPPRTAVPAQAQTGLAEKAGASELEADRPAGEGVVVGA